MEEGKDYDLLEHGEDRWSILYQDIEFIIDSITYSPPPDDPDEPVVASIQYTIISDKKPPAPNAFDRDVELIIQSIVEDVAQEKKNEVDKD